MLCLIDKVAETNGLSLKTIMVSLKKLSFKIQFHSEETFSLDGYKFREGFVNMYIDNIRLFYMYAT